MDTLNLNEVAAIAILLIVRSNNRRYAVNSRSVVYRTISPRCRPSSTRWRSEIARKYLQQIRAIAKLEGIARPFRSKLEGYRFGEQV